MYVKEYDTKPSTVKIGEVDVPLPKMPKKSEILNSKKTAANQKFERTVIPSNLKQLTQAEQADFIEAEWHKRINGVWIYIKGSPYYITGQFYFYLNYWYLEDGRLPDFRMKDLEWFLFWDYCQLDPDCYGMLQPKSRRQGASSKAGCVVYETITRYRNTSAGIQSLTDMDALKFYERIVRAHTKMIYFFKPINSGTTNPKKGLKFELPSTKITNKSRKEKEQYGIFTDDVEDVVPLNSEITYGATKETEYDGQRLKRYVCDEYGKMTNMNPITSWDIKKPCLHLDNGMRIVGKALFLSTIEDMSSGDTLENSIELWENSNPNNKDANGRTETGLYRFFADALHSAPIDEWGFAKEKEYLERRAATIKHLQEQGKYKELIAYRRKEPMSIEDAHAQADEHCEFDRDSIEAARYRVINNIDWKGQYRKEPYTMKGDLVWRDGIRDTEVVWIPSRNGKWTISQLPDKANKYKFERSKRYPANVHNFCLGADPYDHSTNSNKRSDGSGTVFRKYDVLIDGGKEKGDWLTDQFVCTYNYRHENPQDYYEDMIKTCFFYGCQMLYESNKPAIGFYFETRGYRKYLMIPPKELGKVTNRRQHGAPSTEKTIGQYIEALQAHIHENNELIHFIELLDQFLTFRNKKEVRRTHDGVVSAGFALLASKKPTLVRDDDEIFVQAAHPLFSI